MNSELSPLLVTARDAAKLLAVSERTLWGLTAAGELPAVRIGRAVRYSVSDLKAWIARKCAAPCAVSSDLPRISSVSVG